MSEKIKFHQFRGDGFVVPYNPELEGHKDFVVIEVAAGVDPNPAEFHAPQTDEDAEAQELAALERARALIARHEAKAAAAAEAAKAAEKGKAKP